MTVLAPPLPAPLPSSTGSLLEQLPQHVASRALTQAATLVAGAWLVTAPVVIFLGPDWFHVPACLGVLAGMAAAAALCTYVVARRPRLLPAATAGGMLAVACAVAAFDSLTAVPGQPSNPAVSLTGAACVVAGLVLRLPRAAAVGLALALWHAWWELGPPSAAALPGYLESLLTAAVNVVGAAFVAVSLARSSRQVGELVARLLAGRRAEQARRTRENSAAAARTDLHDSVLTTLSGIAAGWLRSTDRTALRREVERDIRVLADLDEPDAGGEVELSRALRTMSGSSRFEGLTVVLDLPPSCVVPSVVADAVVLAVREALVNVVKHAGAGRARVCVRKNGGELLVSVDDTGRGFCGEAAATGMGLRGIRARMAEVGGRADVVGIPGAGTTVALSVPLDAPANLGPVPPLWSLEGPRRGAIGLSVVAAVAATLSFAIMSGSYADPAPQVAALLLVIAGDALVVATLLRRSGLPRWLSLLLVVRIAAVVLLTGLPLPGCAAMGYEHFSGGGQLITCIVITLLRPRWEAAAAVGAFAVSFGLLAAPLYARGETCGITAVANTALALGLVAAAMTLVQALRRHASIAAEVLAAAESLAAARSAREVRAGERSRLVPVVRGIVGDTLAGLADGRLDPAAPDVRRRCRRDARLVRTFLTQAGEGDDLLADLFARAVALRAEGIDLAIRGSLPRGALGPDHRRAVSSWLDACLRTAGDHGWRAEGLVTVLRTGTEVLVTVVLRDLPAGADAGRLEDAVRGGAPPVLSLDRVEVADGELRATCRAVGELPATRSQAGAPGLETSGATP